MNLARNIWQKEDIFRNKTVFACAVGTMLFTLLPYVANLYTASRISTVVKNNQAAKTWFNI